LLNYTRKTEVLEHHGGAKPPKLPTCIQNRSEGNRPPSSSRPWPENQIK